MFLACNLRISLTITIVEIDRYGIKNRHTGWAFRSPLNTTATSGTTTNQLAAALLEPDSVGKGTPRHHICNSKSFSKKVRTALQVHSKPTSAAIQPPRPMFTLSIANFARTKNYLRFLPSPTGRGFTKLKIANPVQ